LPRQLARCSVWIRKFGSRRWPRPRPRPRRPPTISSPPTSLVLYTDQSWMRDAGPQLSSQQRWRHALSLDGSRQGIERPHEPRALCVRLPLTPPATEPSRRASGRQATPSPYGTADVDGRLPPLTGRLFRPRCGSTPSLPRARPRTSAPPPTLACSREISRSSSPVSSFSAFSINQVR
jgi:hypothetical protein